MMYSVAKGSKKIKTGEKVLKLFSDDGIIGGLKFVSILSTFFIYLYCTCITWA